MESKVFVGNLSFQTTEEELRQLFAQAGEVTSVAIPTDRMSGRPRGFAFIEFTAGESAAAAIQRFNGYELGGRNLRVNEASERAPRPPGGGFGTDRPRGFSRPKGSRRNLRARKRGF